MLALFTQVVKVPVYVSAGVETCLYNLELPVRCCFSLPVRGAETLPECLFLFTVHNFNKIPLLGLF